MATGKGRTQRGTPGRRSSRRANGGDAAAALKKAKPGKAALAKAKGASAQDELLFSITWAERNEPATLTELRYNDAAVTEQRVVAPGKITVSFRRPISAIHRFVWDLLFPKRKLHTLDAAAAVGADKPTSLNSAKDASDHWADKGEL